MANGQTVTRSVGFAIVRVEKSFTVDEVVFAEKGDSLLLGARTLEGLSLTVDSRGKKLVAAGLLPAASSQPIEMSEPTRAPLVLGSSILTGGVSQRLCIPMFEQA